MHAVSSLTSLPKVEEVSCEVRPPRSPIRSLTSPRLKFVKFLGLILDEHLSWEFHHSELAKKLTGTCKIFLEMKSFQRMLSLPVQCFLLSFLQCHLIVWGQTFASYIDQFFNYRIKLSELSHFSLACQHLFQSLKI